jgi:hypothetical protein
MGNSHQNNLPLEPAPAQLVLELRELIDTARSRVAQTVNVELVMLHWHIGDSPRGEASPTGFGGIFFKRNAQTMVSKSLKP